MVLILYTGELPLGRLHVLVNPKYCMSVFCPTEYYINEECLPVLDSHVVGWCSQAQVAVSGASDRTLTAAEV